MADPSNESSCKAFLLKKEKQQLGNISLLFLLISGLYDVSNIFYLRDVFVDILL